MIKSFRHITLFLVICAMQFVQAGRLVAQSTDVVWQLFLDGDRANLKENAPLDSLPAVLNRVVDRQQGEGYYLAEVDSVAVSDSTLKPVRVRFYVNRGPQVRIGQVLIAGTEAFDRESILDLMASRPGRVLDEAVLEEDIVQVLRYYERQGYAFATMQIDTISVQRSEEDAHLIVKLRLNEGDRVRVNDIVLSGGERTRTGYIEQMTGLRKGEWLNQDMEEVYRALLNSQAFSIVNPPRLIRIGNEDVVVQIPVTENDPGAFDLVMGYQPPASSGSGGGLVGNGHLVLRNMFGRGRRLALKLNRLPGQISQVDANLADPFFLRLPLSVEAAFVGLQQDSTYGQQAYRGAIGYTLAGGLQTKLTLSREVTKPGQAGLRLRSGRQLVPQSEILFAGISIAYVRVDRPDNPRRGIHIETSLERGSKQRTSFERTAAGDTSRVRSKLRQERLSALARVYLPTFRQQVVAVGNETRVLVSKSFDVSDLFRFGGAQSLRGYDEDRFRGRFVSRSFVEYRYLFERRAYAYLFFDLGYLDSPATGEGEAQQGLYSGYGLGIQFETGVGLINTSLALAAGDNPSQAKVHVGLSVGL